MKYNEIFKKVINQTLSQRLEDEENLSSGNINQLTLLNKMLRKTKGKH